jgi:hypothetical protein
MPCAVGHIRANRPEIRSFAAANLDDDHLLYPTTKDAS